MNDKLITAAQEEAHRLLREQREFLLALERADGLLRSRKDDDHERVLDRERVAEIVEVLDSEAGKIVRFEITLAVAGTVKAGKSTAINAIVGTEVMPNRARPMTALPTVIRHRSDLPEPRLTVNNAAALNRMAKEIEKKLQDGNRFEEVRKSHDVDMTALLNDLEAGRAPVIDDRHDGRDEAFRNLERINDLLRLGRHEAVGVKLPMEEYDELDEMPSLDVCFRCLVDAAPDSGVLALLDLPGFNEARMSEHLTEVLEEQLEKASAVVVILDYTQLNTEASEELEVLIEKVSAVMADRVFVLVNKFDQRSANDAYSNAETLSTHIAGDTMRGHVEPGQVYPVSARWAYLASRALEELDRHGRLPSPDDEAWVSDFGKVAFGHRDSNTGPLNSDRAREAANELWLDSKFEAPLRGVVLVAQNRATTLALESALAKLNVYGTQIEDHLNLSIGSMTAEIKELQDAIRHIDQKAQHTKRAKDRLDKTAKTTKEAVIDKIGEELDNVKTRMENDIEKAFDQQLGILEDKETNGTPTLVREDGSNLESFPFSFFSTGTRRKGKELSKAGKWWKEKERLRLLKKFREKEELEYTNEMEYEDARNLIHSVYSDIAKQLVGDAISSIRTVTRNEITQMTAEVACHLNEMLDEARDVLSGVGIEVSFSIPYAELDRESIKASTVRLSRDVRTRLGSPHTVITNRFWNFLDPFDLIGLGKEEVRGEETYYVINRKITVEELRKALEETSVRLSQAVERLVEDWREECDKKVNGVNDLLDRYLQTLEDGIGDQRRDRRRAQELVESARQLQRRSEHSRAEAKAFQEAIKAL